MSQVSKYDNPACSECLYLAEVTNRIRMESDATKDKKLSQEEGQTIANVVIGPKVRHCATLTTKHDLYGPPMLELNSGDLG